MKEYGEKACIHPSYVNASSDENLCVKPGNWEKYESNLGFYSQEGVLSRFLLGPTTEGIKASRMGGHWILRCRNMSK